MSKLGIITIEYDGQRLEDIGAGVVSALEPLVSGFDVIKRLDLRDLVLNFEPVQELYKPPKLALKPLGDILPYKNPTLLVSNLPLLSQMGSHMLGIANEESKLAYVSTYKPDFGELDSEEHVERVVVEALHELGHCFGLGHHEERVETHKGKLCLMTVAHDGDFIRGRITGADYISMRDKFFCGRCYVKLGIQDPSLRLSF